MIREIDNSVLAKRSMDVVVAGLLLVIVSPVMLVIAIVVRLTTPGPALFRQRRVGDQQQPFAMLKFRTMYHQCDDNVHREYVSRMLPTVRWAAISGRGSR